MTRSRALAPSPRRFRPWQKVGLAAAVVLAVLVAASTATGLWARARLRASLPQLTGTATLAGLSGPVTIERDALGIPSIQGRTRVDVSRALGWLHGQDRFFQMDLSRRRAAGELAELFGPLALELDRTNRVHRFRQTAEDALRLLPPGERELLEAYAEGVNAGLAGLGERPFEYLLLRSDPAPWRPEDSLLVDYSMFLELQDATGARESRLGVMHDLLPPALFGFLAPRGDEFDSPVEGTAFQAPPIPGPDAFDLRHEPSRAAGRLPTRGPWDPWRGRPASSPEEAIAYGSNNWALSGDHTANGAALVANDMHLDITVPNVWYRASLAWQGPQGGQERMTGLTLPGAPAVIVGSNGRIAWGFTNSWGDWGDLIELEVDPADPDRYLTPEGPRSFERHRESIRVKGQGDEALDLAWTIWGPVLDRDHRGRARAYRWVAHDAAAVNFAFGDLEAARDVDEGLAAARRLGIPAQNLVVGDREGRIGWTIAGRIPRRVGFDGRLPSSWADGTRGWNGWLGAAEHPAIVSPPGGRIWTANSRVVEGAAYEAIGDGGYDHGARARQIRDALMAVEAATPADMLAIQLDDRALLLERWRSLVLDVLSPAAIADRPERAEFRRLVEMTWTGRASIDSVAYRLVRTFRVTLAREVLGALTAACLEADPRFNVLLSRAYETPLWALVTARPPHLLSPTYPDWTSQLLAGVDATITQLTDGGRDLAGRTWGERNTPIIRHPLTRALPWLTRWLAMPPRPLPGDVDMPRVQGLAAGASERMVVSPGHEADGVLHMPVGQSGHPLSPHFADGHEAWREGRPTPFLGGPAVDRLTLQP